MVTWRSKSQQLQKFKKVLKTKFQLALNFEKLEAKFFQLVGNIIHDSSMVSWKTGNDHGMTRNIYIHESKVSNFGCVLVQVLIAFVKGTKFLDVATT